MLGLRVGSWAFWCWVLGLGLGAWSLYSLASCLLICPYLLPLYSLPPPSLTGLDTWLLVFGWLLAVGCGLLALVCFCVLALGSRSLLSLGSWLLFTLVSWYWVLVLGLGLGLGFWSWVLVLEIWVFVLGLGSYGVGSWVLVLGLGPFTLLPLVSWLALTSRPFILSLSSPPLTGLDTWLLAFGFWFLAFGCRLSAVGTWLSFAVVS